MAERQPRLDIQELHAAFTFRFTPTSASWVNPVEGCFLNLSRQRLKHRNFSSLDE